MSLRFFGANWGCFRVSLRLLCGFRVYVCLCTMISMIQYLPTSSSMENWWPSYGSLQPPWTHAMATIGYATCHHCHLRAYVCNSSVLLRLWGSKHCKFWRIWLRHCFSPRTKWCYMVLLVHSKAEQARHGPWSKTVQDAPKWSKQSAALPHFASSQCWYLPQLHLC